MRDKSNKKYINPNDFVASHEIYITKTLEDYKRILVDLQERGYQWAYDSYRRDDWWKLYREHTCIHAIDSEGYRFVYPGSSLALLISEESDGVSRVIGVEGKGTSMIE